MSRAKDDRAFADTVAGTPDPDLGVTAPTLDVSSDPGSTADLLPVETHEVLASRWEIRGLVGAGGMGTVYRAYDRELDEFVALKMMRAERVGGDLVERFRQEVKLARRVTHKNVARVFEFGEHAGRPFFTMELVEGQSLRARLDQRGRLSLREVVSLGTTIARGLAAAHEVGIIHRDLKVDNVLIATDGRVAITDFGIAATLDASGNKRNTSAFLGTPHYMAPEQVDGAHPISERTDIYALGTLLYELLTNETPFTGPSPIAVAAARLVHPAPSPKVRRADVPDALATIVLTCMARDPSARYGSAEMVAAALETVEQADTRVPTLVPPASSSVSREGGRFVRVAVLPLVNRGKAEDDDLVDGLTDDLIDLLSSVRGVRVVARGLVEKFRERTDLDLRAIGSELEAEVLVDGSAKRVDAARLELRTRLVSTQDGIQLWGRRFKVSASDLLGANDEATAAIAEAVMARATANERHLSNPAVVDLYLRARSRSRGFWGQAAAEAVEMLEKALSLEPNAPILRAGYATALARLSFFDGSAVPRAIAAAREAVQLAPELAEAHLAAAAAEMQTQRVAEAYRSANAAIQRAPSLADGHLQLGRILSETGPAELAMQSLDLSLELDPTQGLAWRERGRMLSLLRRWEDATRWLEDRSPVDPFVVTAQLLGGLRQAIWRHDVPALRTLRVRLGANHEALGGMGAALERLAGMLAAAADAGRKVTGAELDPAFPVRVSGGSARRVSFFMQLAAEAAAQFGERDEAMMLVDAAIDEGALIDLLWIDRCAALDGLREDPEWLSRRAKVVERVRPVYVLMGRAHEL